jgi:peptide/nickel transport system substrate-binding protein
MVIALATLLNSFSSYAQSHPKIYTKVVYSLPLTFDPIQMNDTASTTAVNMIHEGLVKFNSSLEVVPALAKSWDISSDGKTITFNLHENAQFHNGGQVSSTDVVYSLKRAMSPMSKVASLYDSIIDLRSISKFVVEVKLKHAYPPILSILAGSTAKILPEKLVNVKDFFIHPVGAGAFKFESIDKVKKQLKLAANKKYIGGSPHIDFLLLKEIPEADSVELALKGKVDDLSNWPLSAKSNAFKVGRKITTPTSATWIIGLNTTKSPFNKKEIRQLFVQSINTDELRKNIFPDALAAYGYIPYGLIGSKDIPDPKKILSKTTKPPKEKITIVVPEILQEGKAIKEFLEKDLRDDGWNVEVKLKAWDKIMDGYNKKLHQAFLVSMNMDYPDADFLLKSFESTNPDNFSGIKNNEIDQLIRTSRSSQDRGDREKLYFKALALVEDESVTVNLFHPRANYWISKCVEGFAPNILSDVYIDYSKISLKENCKRP